jgi:hypothetical protein
VRFFLFNKVADMLYEIWHWITSWIIGLGGIGALVAAIAWALWFFCPAILLDYKSQLLHIAIGATVFALASSYFYTHGYKVGYQVAINQVAAKTQEAKDAITKASKSVDECDRKHGNWDVTSGLCEQ